MKSGGIGAGSMGKQRGRLAPLALLIHADCDKGQSVIPSDRLTISREFMIRDLDSDEVRDMYLEFFLRLQVDAGDWMIDV